MGISLRTAPALRTVSVRVGAVVVDSASLALATWGLSELVSPCGADEVLFYWTADALTSTDNIGVNAILLDTSNNRYVIAGSVMSLKANTLATVKVHGCGFYLVVSAVSVTAAVNLRIWAASVLPAPALTLDEGRFEMPCSDASDGPVQVLADFRGACTRMHGTYSVGTTGGGKVEQRCNIGGTIVTADKSGSITGVR